MKATPVFLVSVTFSPGSISHRSNVPFILQTRMSVVTFGDGVYKQDAIDFNDFTSPRTLKTAISKLPYRDGAKTDAAKAIR